MLPTSAGLNPRSGLQSEGASNWATEAGYASYVLKWILSPFQQYLSHIKTTE